MPNNSNNKRTSPHDQFKFVEIMAFAKYSQDSEYHFYQLWNFCLYFKFFFVLYIGLVNVWVVSKTDISTLPSSQHLCIMMISGKTHQWKWFLRFYPIWPPCLTVVVNALMPSVTNIVTFLSSSMISSQAKEFLYRLALHWVFWSIFISCIFVSVTNVNSLNSVVVYFY